MVVPCAADAAQEGAKLRIGEIKSAIEEDCALLAEATINIDGMQR
jgi:hypothetical protein